MSLSTLLHFSSRFHLILIHVQIPGADLLFSLILIFCWLTLIRPIAFSRYDLALSLVVVVAVVFAFVFCFIYLYFVICQLEIKIFNSIIWKYMKKNIRSRFLLTDTVWVNFVRYLSAPWPALGHYPGRSLTHTILIIGFKLDSKVTKSLVARLDPWCCQSAQFGLN